MTRFRLCAVLCGLLPAAAPGPALAQPQLLSVRVDAVYVNVLAVDRDGKPVTGLQREQFRIFEDGHRQNIENFFSEEVPLSLLLLLDTSFSTIDRLPLIQEAALRFLERTRREDRIAVGGFDDRIWISDFSSQPGDSEKAVNLLRTGHATRLHDAVDAALARLKQESNRRVLVVFSDGVDSASRMSARQARDLAIESDVTIYTILFNTRDFIYRHAGRLRWSGPLRPDPRDRHSQGSRYLDNLAKDTGGVRLKAGKDLTRLDAAFDRIVEELRSLYTLSYVSDNPKMDGKFRKIKVKVERSGLKVRARKGYWAAER